MATPRMAAVKPPQPQIKRDGGRLPSILPDTDVGPAPTPELAPDEDHFKILDEFMGISGEEKQPKDVKAGEVETVEKEKPQKIVELPAYNLLERARAKFVTQQTPDDPLGLVRALKSLIGRVEPARRAVPNFDELKPEEQDALIQAFSPIAPTPEEEAAGMSLIGEAAMSVEGGRSVIPPARIQTAAKTREAFDSFVGDLLKREGGYVNRPDDAGGETNFGISKRSYPKEDIKGLTKERATEIYKKDYWDKVRGDDLPDQIARVVADIAVNSGVSTIQKRLNKRYGIKKSGFSDDLLYAIEQDIKERGEQRVVEDLITEQEDLYFKLAESPRRNDLSFIEGWINRANDLREDAGLKRTSSKADTNAASKELQRAINAFLDPKDHLRVDGTIGTQTKKRLAKLKPAIRKRLLKEYFSKLRSPEKVKRSKPKKKKITPKKRNFIADTAKGKEEIG